MREIGQIVAIGCESRGWVQPIEGEVDPVGHADTTSNQGTFNHDQHSSLVRGRTFGLPHGDGRGVHTVAYTSDDSTDNELSDTVGGLRGRKDEGQSSEALAQAFTSQGSLLTA